MRSSFGTVFVAKDIISNDLVAVKKVILDGNPELINNEVLLLKECRSRYTVNFYDIYKMNNELWVAVRALW